MLVVPRLRSLDAPISLRAFRPLASISIAVRLLPPSPLLPPPTCRTLPRLTRRSLRHATLSLSLSISLHLYLAFCEPCTQLTFRTYYEKLILVPVPKTGLYPKKLVYKFGPNAHGWNTLPGAAVASSAVKDEPEDDDDEDDMDGNNSPMPETPPALQQC